MSKVAPKIFTLDLEGYDDRGYAKGELEGRSFRVLGALSGETVQAELIKRKKGKSFCVAKEIVKESPYRIQPRDASYLSTSPWQILQYETELEVKRAHILQLMNWIDPEQFIVEPSTSEWGYRNKIEYSFFYDDSWHLAFHKRDSSRGKVISDRCSIASPQIEALAKAVLELINRESFPFGSLKGLTVRSSEKTETASAKLYVKDPALQMGESFKNSIKQLGRVQVVYSDRLSPAFLTTEVLFGDTDLDLVEEVAGVQLGYPFDGFFQVNPPTFGEAIRFAQKKLATLFADEKQIRIVDLYAGVGSIGILLANYLERVNINCLIEAVELTDGTKPFAIRNSKGAGLNNFSFTEMDAARFSTGSDRKIDLLIVDPPRAGLSQEVIQSIFDLGPDILFYLSCNPTTQAEDFKKLGDTYSPLLVRAFDFYPHTPHVENLIIARRGGNV